MQELRNFIQDPQNLKVSIGNNIRQWIITVIGGEDTIYAGEKFRLKFSFPPDYPFSPPAVFFLQPIPKHEHVYSNGDICLNLLGMCVSMSPYVRSQAGHCFVELYTELPLKRDDHVTSSTCLHICTQCVQCSGVCVYILMCTMFVAGPGWMPTMTAQGIAMSIVSMLSSAKEKKIPPDNAVRK